MVTGEVAGAPTTLGLGPRFNDEECLSWSIGEWYTYFFLSVYLFYEEVGFPR